jgi:hypothetical protein
VAVRSPQLYYTLRCFCLGAFSLLARDVEEGAEIEFAFEEHMSRDRPALYEYRPLVRQYVETRSERISQLADTRLAIEELRNEPAAKIFASAQAGSLFQAILLPLIVDLAETCGGFDWDDATFDHAYAALEETLFRGRRSYAAVAPLVGLSAGSQIDLGRGLRIRAAAEGELSAHWPQARGLLPPGFGREPDQLCVLELEHELPPGEDELPDAPGEIADAVTALRLATAGPVTAGPVLFERLDWRPLAIRPVLPIAATQPEGEPIRLDAFRGRLAHDLLERIGAADDDPELAEALDRWELSLFAAEPFQAEQLRESMGALLGGTDGLWAAAIRGAVLLGETASERATQLGRLRRLASGENADGDSADAVRRALVEAVVHGDRALLIDSLDESLLGLRPRPAGYFAAIAS